MFLSRALANLALSAGLLATVVEDDPQPDDRIERETVNAPRRNCNIMSKVALDRADSMVCFRVYVVRCVLTGGRFVSVRKVDARVFRRVLEAGMNDPNFDMPVLRSFREHGSEAHTITAVAAYTDRKEALRHQAPMIEKNAELGLSLNASRPREGSSPDFAWMPKDYVTPAEKRAIAKLKAAKVARKSNKKQPATESAVA